MQIILNQLGDRVVHPRGAAVFHIVRAWESLRHDRRLDILMRLTAGVNCVCPLFRGFDLRPGRLYAVVCVWKTRTRNARPYRIQVCRTHSAQPTTDEAQSYHLPKGNEVRLCDKQQKQQQGCNHVLPTFGFPREGNPIKGYPACPQNGNAAHISPPTSENLRT